MGYPSKGSYYPDLKSDTSIAKSDQNKLKQFAEQLKSVFPSKIELNDRIYREKSEIFFFLIFKIIPH